MTDGEDRILTTSEKQSRNAELRQQRQQIEIARAQARLAMQFTDGEVLAGVREQRLPECLVERRTRAVGRRKLSSRISASGGICPTAASHALDGGGRPEVGAGPPQKECSMTL